jgi:hypothetical protein
MAVGDDIDLCQLMGQRCLKNASRGKAGSTVSARKRSIDVASPAAADHRSADARTLNRQNMMTPFLRLTI